MMRLTCKEASLLSSQSLDRRLSWGERSVLRLHLFVCQACTRFKRQIEFLHAAVRAGTAQRNNEHFLGLSAAARARIRYSLQNNEP